MDYSSNWNKAIRISTYTTFKLHIIIIYIKTLWKQIDKQRKENTFFNFDKELMDKKEKILKYLSFIISTKGIACPIYLVIENVCAT